MIIEAALPTIIPCGLCDRCWPSTISTFLVIIVATFALMRQEDSLSPGFVHTQSVLRAFAICHISPLCCNGFRPLDLVQNVQRSACLFCRLSIRICTAPPAKGVESHHLLSSILQTYLSTEMQFPRRHRFPRQGTISFSSAPSIAACTPIFDLSLIPCSRIKAHTLP